MERQTDAQRAEFLLRESARSATEWTYFDGLWVEGTASDVLRKVLFAQQAGLPNERIIEIIQQGEQQAGERITRSCQAVSLPAHIREGPSEAEVATHAEFMAITLLEMLVDQLSSAFPNYSGEQIQELLTRRSAQVGEYVDTVRL